MSELSVELKLAIAEYTSTNEVGIKEDYLMSGEEPLEYEILLGNTNREESLTVLDSLKYDDYKITAVGKKIVITAHNEAALEKAVEHFIADLENMKDGDDLCFTAENECFYDHKYPMDECIISGVPVGEYKLVIDRSAPTFIKNTYGIIVERIRDASGDVIEVVKDSKEESEYEIIFGETTRSESSKYYSDSSYFKENEYTIDVVGNKIVVAGCNDEFTMRKAAEDLCNMLTVTKLLVSKIALAEAKIVLTSACFSDSHNNFAMLEPTNSTGDYVFRKTHSKAIDLILDTRGQVDVVMVGGDLVSDYPHWDSSGWWPYKYYVEYKQIIVDQFSRLSKEGKVIYIAGNHDYAQGELSTDAPHTEKGNYNSSEYYFTGPMNVTMGELADEDMHWIVGTHTGDKYLLGYHYEVNGVHFIGLSPDPDAPGIWSKQEYGFHPDTLTWFKNTLERIDPNGREVIFVNCHYHLAHRSKDVLKPKGQADNDIIPIIKGHSNLFWFFGHLHTGENEIAQSHTSEMVVHYNKKGVALDTPAIADSYGSIGNRGPTTVYMGAGRIDYDGKYFGMDTIRGYGGYDTLNVVRTTATPTLCQVMYVTVYEDRVELQSINVGSYKGYTVDDIIAPYTVYLYK